MIVTVDGPAAAGKSTVARELARRLNSAYLDSGAFYRALTWQALRAAVNLSDPAELSALAARTCVELEMSRDGLRVICDGVDVTAQIRRPEVTENIHYLADQPSVRRVLIERQRAFARQGNLVAEGRDQGTDVFPDADLKFYLDASLDERARRRQRDLRASGLDVTLEEVRRQVAERDARDRSRPMGALRKTDDMIVIDSTGKSVEQVVMAMMDEVERRRRQLSLT